MRVSTRQLVQNILLDSGFWREEMTIRTKWIDDDKFECIFFAKHKKWIENETKSFHHRMRTSKILCFGLNRFRSRCIVVNTAVILVHSFVFSFICFVFSLRCWSSDFFYSLCSNRRINHADTCRCACQKRIDE